MTAFPAIEPDTRAYDLAGDFPMLDEQSWPSFSTRYRTGNTTFTATGLQLTLTYQDRPQAQWIQFRNHYNTQQGGAIPFTLPAIILQGQSFSLVRPNSTWRYVNPPEEQHRNAGLATVTIQLESTGFDYGATVPSTRLAITGNIGLAMGLQTVIAADLAAGMPEFDGFTLSVDSSIGFAAGIHQSVVITFDPGEASAA